MPRYHFHIYDDETWLDPVGVELPGLVSARIEALRRAMDAIHDAVARVGLGEGWRMDVADGSGLVLFTMRFVGPGEPLSIQHPLRH